MTPRTCDAIIETHCCQEEAAYQIVGRPSIYRLACEEHMRECILISLRELHHPMVQVYQLDENDKSGRSGTAIVDVIYDPGVWVAFSGF